MLQRTSYMETLLPLRACQIKMLVPPSLSALRVCEVAAGVDGAVLAQSTAALKSLLTQPTTGGFSKPFVLLQRLSRPAHTLAHIQQYVLYFTICLSVLHCVM